MDITLKRSELSDVVNRAAAIAPSASVLKELEGVLLETNAATGTLTVTATNLEITLEQRLSCETDEDDALVAGAGLFQAMLKRLAGDTVTLRRQTGANTLTVTCGDAEYHIPVLERKSFPNTEVAFPDDTVPVTGIPALVRRSTFAVSARDDNALLKCVNLRFTRDGLMAVGSDGMRLVSTKGDKKSTGDISLLVLATSLNVLARISTDKDEYRVGHTGKSIVFSKPDLLFTARVVEQEYIDTDRIVGSVKNAFTVLTDIADLRRALLYVNAADPEGYVRLLFQGTKLIFYAAGAFGAANTAIEVTPLIGAPSGEYWQNARKLDDCLRVLSGTATLGMAQGGILTLSTEESFYFQQSVRPPQRKPKPQQETPKAEETAKAKEKVKNRRSKKAA